jgi:hypothetical protein
MGQPLTVKERKMSMGRLIKPVARLLRVERHLTVNAVNS